MNRKLFALGLGCACLCTALLGAALAQQTPPRNPTAEARAHDMAAVTVEGCLMREADVPGRKPPDADRERVKRDDDFVLAQATMVKGTPPAAAPDAKDRPTGTAGSAAAPLTFKVEKLSATELQENRGRRVQIDGTFRHENRADNPVSPATELVKLDGTAIRQVAGDCPSK